MRKTTKAQIEADARLAQTLAKLQSFIEKTQRHIDKRKDELKAEVDALFVQANNELEVLRSEMKEMEAELRGPPTEGESGGQQQPGDEPSDQAEGGNVAAIGRGRR